MPCVRSALLIALATCASQAAPPESCAVTKPPNHVFVPPPPHAALPERDSFYFGSDDLWMFLPNDAVWSAFHDNANYERRKIAWFSKSFWYLSHDESNLKVEARKLDGVDELVQGGIVTSGLIPDRQESFMLSSIEFTSTGCWEVSAHYHDHELRFVIWVVPYTASSNSSKAPAKK